VNKKYLFDFLEKQDASTLLRLLNVAFDTLTVNQRHEVFGQLKLEVKASQVNEKELLKEVKKFYNDSLRGVYYAPFNINSKNFMHIPEETEEWFEKLADLLGDTAKVSEKGSHELAVECFKILYELIDKMQDGDDIVFADEYGTWMIPADEKVFIRAFLISLSAVSSPEEFVEGAIPLLKRDSYESLHNKVYKTAVEVANGEQKKALESAIKTLKIKAKIDLPGAKRR
jgi:hypothetical protein